MITLEGAACRDYDPQFFFPAPEDHEAIDAARSVCAHCPARLDCLALALRTPDAHGIWGGLTERERAAQRRRQRREHSAA